jgi:protein-S-isoprenylcysteine O-methyltransferase Ste14
MRWLELRVPPPLAAVLVGLLMWLFARWLAASHFDLPARGLISSAIALAGLIIAAIAFFQVRRAGTTVNPRKPHEASALVTSGLYRFSRNPMYLADVLLLAAWAAWLANAAALVGLPLFVVYLNRYQIELEERALQARFGAAYAAYRATVRRWL